MQATQNQHRQLCMYVICERHESQYPYVSTSARLIESACTCRSGPSSSDRRGATSVQLPEASDSGVAVVVRKRHVGCLDRHPCIRVNLK